VGDEGNDRQLALDVFDAFGSKDNALRANISGHTGSRGLKATPGKRFFARHLR
jgi:hypothetical protein